MKIIHRILLIALVFASFSLITYAKTNDLNPKASNPFYPTQADMLNASSNRLEKVDRHYNEICNRIIQNFKSDKNFVTAFQKDKVEFLKYRSMQVDVILPAYNSDPTAYGSNYGLYSEGCIFDLTNSKIKSLKKVIDGYCLYNDFAQPDAACTPARIESLFK